MRKAPTWIAAFLMGAIVSLAVFAGCSSAGAKKVYSNVSGEISKHFTSSETTASANTSATAASVGEISVYFPRGGQNAEGQLIAEIGSAKKTLDVAIYEFTDTKIASVIAAAISRGVKVRMITDRECSSQSAQKKALAIVKASGIPIKMNSHQGIMHLKVSIIDSSAVTTGSFNYTLSAQNENDENLVVINNTSVNAQYESQFARMWADSSNFEDWNG